MTDTEPTNGYNLACVMDREDRRKHLELVSTVVGRMAAASAAAKGWSITLAGAAFGVALVRDKGYLIVLGIVALVLFGIMDGLYLTNEKKFRALYKAIAEQNAVKPFSMDVSGFGKLRKESFCSWSVLGFYVPLIIGGSVILAVVRCIGGSPADEKSQSPTVTTSTVTVTETTTTQQAPPPPTSPTVAPSASQP